MAMCSELSASLTISGDHLNFSECTTALGINPTQTWTRPYDYDSNVVPSKQWVFGFEKKVFDSVSDAVAELFQMIYGKEERILSFASNNGYRTTVTCSVAILEDRPLYDLATEQIVNIANIGAEFMMDIYDYSSG
jgi:hypothetical protein